MQLKDYFGIIASLSLLVSIMYAYRRREIKRFLSRRWDNAVSWRNLHLYGGLTFAVAFLIHVEFSLPTGLFSWMLYILSWWTIIAGILGWFMQWWLPRKLTTSTQTEVVFERIPSLCNNLRDKCAKIAETCPAILADFHNTTIANFMLKPYLVSPIQAIQMRTKIFSQFEILKARLPYEQKHEVEEMAYHVRAKFDLDTHFTLQTILRLWIYLHAPASFLLALFVLFHIFAVIYY